MSNMGRARAMRAEGKTMREIANAAGISLQWAYKCAGDVMRGEPAPTDTTVVRYGAINGGCSTLSGLQAISMPRIAALHGVAA